MSCIALWGTFDDAFARLNLELSHENPIWYLSFGSFFGNDHFTPAVNRLTQWRSLMRPDDRMLLGMDAQDRSAPVWNMYHDPAKTFERFMRNGLRNSNAVLDHDWYEDTDWEIAGSLEEGPPIRHKFVFRAVKEVRCKDLELVFAKGDEIDCYEVFKYGPEVMAQQFSAAGLQEIAHFKSSSGTFCTPLNLKE